MADSSDIELASNIVDDGVDDNQQEETAFSKFMDVLFDQDTQQMLGALGILGAQLYQAVIGSALLVFVPQSCNDSGELCDFADRVGNVGSFYTFGIFFNFLTLATTLCLYAIESKREKYLIDHMDTSLDYANDEDEVTKRLDFLSPHVRESIHTISLWYARVGYMATVFYIANVVISAICISEYLVGSQSWSTFATNVLSVLFKIMDVYATISTGDAIFLSAYLKTKVQFNDIDESHKTEESEKELLEEDAEDKMARLRKQHLAQKERQKLKTK